MGREMKKKSFVFNVEWQEVLLDYPAEVRLEVYDAIIEYVASGTLSELKPMAKMAFSFIKREIDYNNERYQEMVIKRSKAGKKSAEKRYSKESPEEQIKMEDKTNATRDNTCNKTNTCCQVKTNLTDNDNEYDYEKEESTSDDVPKKDGLSLPPIDYNALCQHFNERFAGILPKVTSVTEARRKAIRARIAEHGRESVIKVFDAIKASDFLKGHNDRNWKCDFDWIFRPTNYIKILEGTYANHPAQGMDVGVVLQDGKTKRYEEGW